jgi:hypothetical protein
MYYHKDFWKNRFPSVKFCRGSCQQGALPAKSGRAPCLFARKDLLKSISKAANSESEKAFPKKALTFWLRP